LAAAGFFAGAAFFAAGFLAAVGFFAGAAFFTAGFLAAAGFFAGAAFFAAGFFTGAAFLAAGFLAAGFFAAGFLAFFASAMLNLLDRFNRKRTQPPTSTRTGLVRIIQRPQATESVEFLMFFHPSLRLTLSPNSKADVGTRSETTHTAQINACRSIT
jgi:hypothetical protein